MKHTIDEGSIFAEEYIFNTERVPNYRTGVRVGDGP
jgi:hypothetical protein